MAVQAGKLVENLPRFGAGVVPVRVNRRPSDQGLLHRVKGVRTVATTSRFLRDLLRALPHSDVVVIFSAFFNYFFWVTCPAILLAHAKGKPIILSARGGGAGEFCRRYRPILKPLMKRVHLVTAPSPYLSGVFRALFPVDVRIMRTIIDTEQFRFRERFPLRPRLLAARNLEDIYGIDVIIKAMTTVQKNQPKASLTIAGNGSRMDSLKKLVAKAGLQQQITFVGAVPHHQMPSLYRDHDIFVNASRVDNLPNVILEAFAAGLPVVSTKAGGIPYLVDHGRTGWLADIDDDEGLASAIVHLLERPEEARVLTWNAKKEAEEYSAAAVIPAFLRMVDDLVTKHLARS